MKYLALLFLLIAVPCYAGTPADTLREKLASIPPQDFTAQGEAINAAIYKFKFLTEKCSEPQSYIDFFQLVPFVTGSDSSELYGEYSAKAIILCPEAFLNALITVEEPLRANVTDSVWAILPPWETAEAVYPYLDNPKYKDLMDNHFRIDTLDCTDSAGKAKIGCTWGTP